jgi:chemotaxis protein CheD
MSHITNPKSRKNKNGTPIKYPHKFIDTSVKDLLDKILYYGANRENVEAIIIGGAKTIYDKGTISQKNIKAIRNELKKYNIKIDKELLGGISERSIIFDINENMLYVKKIWEEEYRKID